MGARSMTVGRYEESGADWPMAAECVRLHERSTVRATLSAKCAMGCATHPMRRKLARIRCGCCNWIGWQSFTIWDSVIH